MRDEIEHFRSKKLRKRNPRPAVYAIYLKATTELLWIGKTDDLERELFEHYYYNNNETLRGCIKNDDSIDIPIDSLEAKTAYKREIESSEAKRTRIKKTLDEELNPRYDVNRHEKNDEEHTSTTDGEIPLVPQIKVDSIEVEMYKTRYERLRDDNRFSPGNAPATTRKIIHEYQKLSKPDFLDFIEKEGYTRDSGEIGACLSLLDNITDEIERYSEGGTKYIAWTGN